MSGPTIEASPQVAEKYPCIRRALLEPVEVAR